MFKKRHSRFRGSGEKGFGNFAFTSNCYMSGMSKLGKILATHPLAFTPYDKLEFVRLNNRKVPLYIVEGCSEDPCGAFDALGKAFRKYGGPCFYCGKKLKPQGLSCGGPHRDHVIAQSKDGDDLLHNLVIACGKCGAEKANKPIERFRPHAAGRYLEALNRHISICMKRDFQHSP